MHHPAPARLHPLDMEAQEGEAVVDMGDTGLLVREFQVEVGLEEVTDDPLSRSDVGNAAVAHDHKVISKAHHFIIAESYVSSLVSCVWRPIPLFCRPLVKFIEIDVGKQWR